MPEGVGEDISVEEMGHLRLSPGQWCAPKQFLATAEVVRPFVDGSIPACDERPDLRPKIVFEERYDLGYWSSEEDHAAWNLEVEKVANRVNSTTPAMTAAGDRYVVSIAGQTVGGKVTGTETGIRTSLTAGTVKLEKGPELLIRSEGRSVCPHGSRESGWCQTGK